MTKWQVIVASYDIKCNVINYVIEDRGMWGEFQRGMEKFQSAIRAGPVANQPGRLRTPPGLGEER